MLARTLFLALFAAASWAPGASAATVATTSGPGGFGTALVYRADPGEVNRVTTEHVSNDVGWMTGVRIIDPGAASFHDLPDFCVAETGAVRCVRPNQASIGALHIELGDGDDVGSPTTFNGTTDGGPGTDRLSDSPGQGYARVLVGGPGPDLLTGDAVSYADHDSPVRVTVDGVADDGAEGERDNVTRAQNVTGGAGDDVLFLPETSATVGTAALRGGPGNDRLVGNRIQDLLNGGPGDDVLEGGPGVDHLVGGPGADLMRGGEGPGDEVDYREAPLTGVTVTLDDAGGDGAPGENDDVRDDVEAVTGTFGGDVLVGSGADNRLFGGGGADTIDGRGGDDTLGLWYGKVTGGAGRDVISAGIVDRPGTVSPPIEIHVADGEVDFVQCAPVGELRLESDPVDDIRNCSPTPAPLTPPLEYRGPSRIAVSRAGGVRLRFGCPAADACDGTIVLRYGGPHGRLVAKKAASIDAGEMRKVAFKLSKPALRRLAGERRSPVYFELRKGDAEPVRIGWAALARPAR